jgi:hypothetical protein
MIPFTRLNAANASSSSEREEKFRPPSRSEMIIEHQSVGQTTEKKVAAAAGLQ